jgi:hypothetical protein
MLGNYIVSKKKRKTETDRNKKNQKSFLGTEAELINE